MQKITLFVSYSHDSPEHKDWVKRIATDLRSHGVDVILDQWDLRLGDDLAVFMEHGLTESKLVICVCSEKFVEKANAMTGGVGYEKMILTQSLLKGADATFVIPVIRGNNSEYKTPLFLGSKAYVDFNDDELYCSKYKDLLECIYAKDVAKKPPLGKNPFEAKYTHEVLRDINKIQYKSDAMCGSVTFAYDDNNGYYDIGEGEYAFRTHWSRSGNDSIYAIGNIGYKHNAFEFPDYNDLKHFNYSSSTRTIHKGEICIFINDHGHFLAVKILRVISSNHGHNKDEMTFEYKVYTGVDI